MTNTGGIPTPPVPAPPATPARPENPPAPAVIQEAPVISLPPGLVPAEAKAVIEARVAEIRQAAQQILLQAEQGMIVIQSTARLQPGTAVTVELQTDPATDATTATVTLVLNAAVPPSSVRIPASASVPAQDAPLSLPLPKPGEVFPAIILTDPKNPPQALPSRENAAPIKTLPLDVEHAVAQLKNFLLAEETPFPVPPAPTSRQTPFTPDFPAATSLSRNIPLPDIPRPLVIALGLLSFLAAPALPGAAKNPAPALLPSPTPLTTIAGRDATSLPGPAPLDANTLELAGARIHARLVGALLTNQPAIPASLQPPAGTPATSAQAPQASVPGNLIRGTIASLVEYLSDTPAKPPAETPSFPATNLQNDNALRPVSLRILAVLPPTPSPQQINGILQGKTETLPAGSPPPLPLVARSGGKTPAGQIFLEAPAGHLIVQAPANAIPKGSIVIAEMIPAALSSLSPPAFLGLPATGLAGMNIPDFNPLTAKSWPAMEEALKLAAGPAPALAANLHASLPVPGPKLASTALFFLAALKGTKIEDWIGPSGLDALKDSGNAKLAERLASDFSRMARQATETLAGDWKAISLPLMNDDQVSRLVFFVRQQQENSGRDPADRSHDESNGRKATRFVLNLSLSRMGPVQLDGLHRPGQLEIVLRTRDSLPPSIQGDITKKYAQAMEQTRMTGQIVFQTKGWIEPPLQDRALTGVSA